MLPLSSSEVTDMTLTSKQRAQLKGLAAEADTIVMIGKSGITDSVIASVDAALTARELVKGRVLEGSMLSAREAADRLQEALAAETVQVIGTKFVLFRRNIKEPKIQLVNNKKKK